jgi:hypothetical protein
VQSWLRAALRIGVIFGLVDFMRFRGFSDLAAICVLAVRKMPERVINFADGLNGVLL